MADALLVGNNLAVLVAAEELGAAGAEVVLVTDGRPAGGHFRGLRLEGIDVDIGMVLLESGGLPTASPVPDLAGYRPGVRYDWTRFGAVVDRWQEAHVDRVRTPTPEVLVGGNRWPDHLIANRLDVLATGEFAPPAPLSREDPRHAAGKLGSPCYDTLPYAAAAEANHGRAIHERLIEPFARKLLGGGYEHLLARYHRAGWLPLYWPETLVDACAGRSTGLPEYPFWTTSSGFVGEVVRSLEQRLETLPGVTVVGSPVGALIRRGVAWEVSTSDGGRWTHAHPVLGLGLERVTGLVGLPAPEPAPGASVVAVFCLVRGAAIGAPVGCLSVVDPSFTAYRLTDQDFLAGRDPEWRRVVVEAGPEAADRARAGEDVAPTLVSELAVLLGLPRKGDGGDVRVLRVLVATSAIAVPSAAAVAADDAACDAIATAMPSALLTGGLLGLGATSMNDQIVQGLAVAERLA